MDLQIWALNNLTFRLWLKSWFMLIRLWNFDLLLDSTEQGISITWGKNVLGSWEPQTSICYIINLLTMTMQKWTVTSERLE